MDKVWWESVPNALRLENSIIEYLESGKQIVFMYSEYIPWPDTFREQIEILQRQNITGYGIDYIKDEEDEEPGYQILNKYCKKEIKDDYRPAIGYARFLANLDSITLNSSIVWIKTYSESRIKLWCDFISDYRHDLKKESDGGMFIIEANRLYDIKLPKGIKPVRYTDYINQFDCYIFNVMAASIIDDSHNVKEYLSEVATSMIDKDIELSSLCLNSYNYKEFLYNPYEVIQRIITENQRSDGSAFDALLDEISFKKALWMAQIKYIFPIIETYRNSFIYKYQNQIQKELPITNSSGDKYDNAIDVEIGTLYYMVCNGVIEVDKNEIFELKKYKDARNKLAHLEILSYEEVLNLNS